jgi:hypothetical protein
MLDHVAIRVVDRDGMRDALLRELEWHVIEETERFTLLGADAEYGKLTLLDAEPGTTPRPVRIISLVLAGGPENGTAPPVALPEGLVVTFASTTALGSAWAHTPRHALIGVSLRALDPPIAAARLEAEHGMLIDTVASDLAVLEVGGPGRGRVILSRERWNHDEVPMLDHVGVRVPSADDWREHAEQEHVEVVKWVEAPHSRAVFVSGPDELLIEFVELTRPLEPA